MKIRARKVAALLLAASLMSVSGNSAVSSAYGAEDQSMLPAETVMETVGAQAETQATEPQTQAPPETQATEPQTQAPTEAQTQAPTEAPTEAQTQAPTEAPTEAQTQAPTEAQTQAPTEAQTQAPTEAQTQAPTEAQTQATETQSETKASETQSESAAAQSESTASSETAASETQSESQSETKATESESESEEEGKKRSFETNTSKGTISIKLPKGKGVVKSAELVCNKTEYSEDNGNRGKVDKVILGRQRVITDARFYEIFLKSGDEVIDIPEGTQITFTRDDGIDLSLKPLLQAKTHLYNVSSDSAEEISGSIDLNGDLRVTGFSFSAPRKLRTFALVAEENRANDGGAVSRGSVISSIGEAGRYAAVGAAVNGEVEDDNISNSEDMLGSLAGYSVSLANAQSSGDAAVVNIYTDSDGNVQTDAGNAQDPMRAVLSGSDIDVSGRMVVLNYVVTNPDTGYVALPHYGVVSNGAAVNRKQNSEQAGRLVVTVTKIAEGTDGNYSLAPYTGEIGIAKRGVGTYLVPQGSISIDGKLTGAAYARTINIGKDIIKSTVRTESGDDAPPVEAEETETEDMAETEADTENVEETESETEAAAADGTEAVTSSEDETQSETQSEDNSTVLTAELPEETMLAPVMLMAAAGPSDDEAMLQAQAEPEIYPNGKTLNNLTSPITVKVYKETAVSTGTPDTSVKGAKLALYSLGEIKYNDGTTNHYIKAGDKLGEWEFDLSDTKKEWNIAPYIVSLSVEGTSSSTTHTDYVIREIQTGTDVNDTALLPAWDMYLTCTTSSSGVTVSETQSTSYSARPSILKGSNTAYTVEMIDAPIDPKPQVIPISVTNSNDAGELLDGVDINVSIQYIKDTSTTIKKESSFRSMSSEIPIDISSMIEDANVTEATLTISEKDYKTGYFDYKTGGSTEEYYNKAEFTVSKTTSAESVVSYTIEPKKEEDKTNLSISSLAESSAGRYKVAFKQQPLTFKVGAKSSDNYIKDTIFELETTNPNAATLGEGDYTVAGSTSTGKTVDSLAEIKLTDEGWKKIHPDKDTWYNLTLEWKDVPLNYTFESTPSTETVFTGSTRKLEKDTIEVNLTPWKFSVGSLDSGSYIDDTGFVLKAGNEKLVSGDYTIAPAGETAVAGTDKTLSKLAEIKLTDEGWKKIHPDKDTWYNLTLNWMEPHFGYYYATIPSKETVFDGGKIVKDIVEIQLTALEFSVGSLYSNNAVPGTAFELKVDGKALGSGDYTIDSAAGTGKTNNKKAAKIQFTKDGWHNLYTKGDDSITWKNLTLEWKDVPYGYYFTDTPTSVPSSPVVVFKDGKLQTGNVVVNLTPWRFNIEALAFGAPLANVKFTLTYNNTAVDYRIDGAAATGATKDSIAYISLADSDTGWKLLHPNATTWNTLKVNWTSVPVGYEFESGAAREVNVSANSEVRINLVPWTFSIGAGVDGKEPYIAGAVFGLKAGNKDLTAGTHYTTTNTTDANALRSISLMAEGIKEVQAAGSLTLNAIKAPDGYTIKGATFTQTVAHGGCYVIPLEVVTPAPTGSISVIKQTRVADGSRYYVPDKSGRTFYVAAFSDTNLATRVAGPARMDVPYSTDTSSNKGSSYQMATLEGLTRGAYYYLAETDQNGTPVAPAGIGVSQITFSDDGNAFVDGNSHPVRLELTEAVKQVYLRNIYPSTGLTTGTFQLKLNVVDHENKPLASALNAGFKIAGGDGTRLKNLKTIQLSNETTKTMKDISYRWSGDKIRITASLQTLTDASGASVLASYSLVDPTSYKVLATGTAIPKYLKTRITLTSAEKNQQTLEFTLKKVKTEKEIAELKLTKAVTYKKTPIRVNGTYYIGIFSDAAHTKILYKKAMSLANASSMTSTLKINLYKLAAPHTITLYFAETDKNGKVVSSGSKSGYDISLNKTSVTLSPTNADESIVLTNNVRDGSVAAANLTNPSSGFAGDSSALAEAQALTNNETKSSKPTGDDTPFEPFAMATGISAGIIFLLLALMAARKKWGIRF